MTIYLCFVTIVLTNIEKENQTSVSYTHLEIPYEKTDYRIMRLLWEHKNCMHMRIAAVEDALGLGNTLRSAYSEVTDSAGQLRTIYGKYCMRRKDNLLLSVKMQLQELQRRETEIPVSYTHLDWYIRQVKS